MRLAHAFSFAAVAAFVVAASACGGKVVIDHGSVTGAGGSSTTTTTTSTGAGGGTCSVAPGGDCATDADCNGGTCAPLADGGYRVCLDVIPEATSCTPPVNGGMNQCCTSADCQAGKCYSTGVFPSCGGPALPIYNACLVDPCTSDDDCPAMNGAPSQACFPAGAYSEALRTCYPAYCHADADCTAQPCGACVPVVGPCCRTPAGLGCVYPGGCHTNDECATGTVCELDPKTGTGVCFSSMGSVCPN